MGPYEGLDPEGIIERVARHGRDSSRPPGALIAYLTKHKHWSPMEHLHLGFKIETSRAISAQFFRHSSLHAQEWSQRYDAPPGFEPIEIRRQHDKNRQSSTDVFDPEITTPDGTVYTASSLIQRHNRRTEELYNTLVRYGVAKECARGILPMASTTIIHLTGNVRDWLAFCNVRLDHHAQKEARMVAEAMVPYIEAEIPGVFSQLDIAGGNFM